MKVLIIGGGGREHALAWKAAQSPLVDEVLIAPGNAGTAKEPRIRNVDVSAADIPALVELAQRESVGLTIVGPEQPLVEGIVDRFEAAGLKCFGPRSDAAQLEGSKAFTKEFLERHQIATAAYRRFTESGPAIEYLRTQQAPIVVKADGLAAGKGVVVAETIEQAETAVRGMLDESRFGDAGAEVVIEEFLDGEEASFIALVDGEDIVPLATSQDHKARDDGDRGPNTGGMGAYSPAPVVTPTMHARIMDEVMRPTVAGLAADGVRYRGFLYAGLMIDASGTPKVLEFNCRFGDPETQPILFRLRSDLVALCLAGCDGRLGEQTIEWDPRTAVGVVMAAAGYPGSYDKGAKISGLENLDSETFKVFHAGTKLVGGDVVTAGGRVLCAVALGQDIRAARDHAYAGIERINWPGAFWRTDIGHRALARG
ncbi:MAG: phosphoribosylamine--glycine ligase [Gammaproteobacteria bacterium]|nr:phosphoribosylamine--glycine ligase [Gammaproteobacteria bacterium]